MTQGFRFRRVRLSAAAVILSAGSLALAATGAEATNWEGVTSASGNSESDPNSCVDSLNRTDNLGVTIYYSSNMPSELINAVTNVRTFVIDPTNVETSIVAEHLESTDVVWASQNYTTTCENIAGFEWYPSGGSIGIYQCDIELANGSCDHAIIRHYKDWVVDRHNEGNSVLVRRTVCHEFGHALSLAHRLDSDDGCMQTPSGNASKWYTPHDLAHINNSSNW